METEIVPLAALIIWQLALGLWATMVVGMHVGSEWLLSSRGTEPGFRDSLAGRLDRARSNGFEAITLFAPIALALSVTGTSTTSTVLCAWAYLAARIVYTLFYALDWTPWRTLVWFIGWFALVWMVYVLVTANI